MLLFSVVRKSSKVTGASSSRSTTTKVRVALPGVDRLYRRGPLQDGCTGPYALWLAPLAGAHHVTDRFGVRCAEDAGTAQAITREKTYERGHSVEFAAPSEVYSLSSVQIIRADRVIKPADENNFAHGFTFADRFVQPLCYCGSGDRRSVPKLSRPSVCAQQEAVQENSRIAALCRSKASWSPVAAATRASSECAATISLARPSAATSCRASLAFSRASSKRLRSISISAAQISAKPRRCFASAARSAADARAKSAGASRSSRASRQIERSASAQGVSLPSRSFSASATSSSQRVSALR